MTSGEGTTLGSEMPYEYDASGNIWGIGERRFAYDGLNRLTWFSWNATKRIGGSTGSDGHYAYDDWGNLTLFRESSPALTLTTDPASNRLSAVTENGGTTANLQWDAARGNLVHIPSFSNQRAKVLTYSDGCHP